MKKKLIALIIGTMGLMLVACSSQNKNDKTVIENVQETESTEVNIPEADTAETDTSDDEIYEGINMANPWVDSDREGVLEAIGWDLVAPDEATNIAYSYMPSTGMAQMSYTMENAMWVYRIQPTEELEDISGIYCEWDYTGETKVSDMDAMEYSYASVPEGDFLDGMECVRVINWYDEQKGVTYSLSVLGPDLNGMDTVVYAENLFKLTADAN